MNSIAPRPWLTVVMLSAVFACSQLDRQIMGILLEPIKRDLGASDSQMGFLVGLAFATFYTFLAIPIAAVADRGHRRTIIAISIMVWSAVTSLCGLVTNFTQMAVARMGVAIGEAGSTPASISIISSLFGEKRRATAMGVFIAGANVGMLLAFLGGGWLLDNVGWRQTFLIVGAPGILLGILVLFTVSEPKAPSTSDPKDRVSVKETLAFMLRSPAIRHLLIAQSLCGFVSYGLVLWLPTFLVRSHGLTYTQIGITLALFAGVGGGLGTLLSGWVVDYLGRFDERWRAWSIAIVKIVTVPFLIGFVLAGDYALALAFYILPAIIGAFYIAPTAALLQKLIDDRMRAVAAAISMFLLNMVGMGLGPQGVGILSDLLAPTFGGGSLRYALAAFALVNLWGAYHFWRTGTLLRASAAVNPMPA